MRIHRLGIGPPHLLEILESYPAICKRRLTMNESVFSEVIPELLSDHFRYLNEGSGISVDMIRERGYRSLLGKSELEKLSFSPSQRRVPGILIPL